MKICENCGYKNPEENTVCDHCHQPLQNRNVPQRERQTDMFLPQDWKPDKKKGRKQIYLLTGICILVLAVAVGVGGLFLYRHQQKESYYKQVSYGNQYLEAEDYEGARDAFLLALDFDKSDEDAYIGLYKAYCAMGQYDFAVNILQRGEKNTDSLQIRTLLQTYLEGGTGGTANLSGSAQSQQDGQENGQSGEITLNSSMLSNLSGENYKYYKDLYGSGQITQREDGSLEVVFDDAGITLTFRNTDDVTNIDSGLNTPYDNAVPESASFSSINKIFTNYDGDLTLEEVEMMNGGNVTRQYSEEAGSDILVIRRGEMTLQIACDENGNITGNNPWNKVLIPSAAVEDEDDVVWVTGKIWDTLASAGVEDMQISFSVSGSEEEVYYAVTDENGQYGLWMEPGSYTASLQKDGYPEEEFGLVVHEGEENQMEDVEVTPNPGVAQVRFVLSWDDSAYTMESHMHGTSSEGYNLHIFGGGMKLQQNGKLYAEMDNGDQNGYQTTILYDNGDYIFHVRGNVLGSGAEVSVYVGDDPDPVVFRVPDTGYGKNWIVCEVKNGQVIEINRVENS